MSLDGSDTAGWCWSVEVGNSPVFKTNLLATDDLSLALFEIQRDADRVNRAFDSIDSADAFALFRGFFYGSFHDALRESAEAQVWAKNNVTPRVPVELSNFMFLVAGARVRFLWGDDELSGSCDVADEFDEQLRECRRRLEDAIDGYARG